MDLLRIIKKITSDRLEELNQYKGIKVEIIINPYIDESSQEVDQNKYDPTDLNKLRGSCPNLLDGMEYQRKIREQWDR